MIGRPRRSPFFPYTTLSGSTPNGRRRLDFLFLGSVREQPPRQILPIVQGGIEAARSRNKAMGPHFLGDRPSFGSVVERSEEHTSELQSRLHLVCRLLLEKKK